MGIHIGICTLFILSSIRFKLYYVFNAPLIQYQALAAIILLLNDITQLILHPVIDFLQNDVRCRMQQMNFNCFPGYDKDICKSINNLIIIPLCIISV